MSDRGDVIYVYDGSFDGLLTAIFESYARRELPAAVIEAEPLQQGLFCTYRTIPTDLEKAERVLTAAGLKINPQAAEHLYYAYLSDVPDRGRLCLDFVRAGLRFGAETELHLAVDCVRRTLDAGIRVRREAHQYKEFVRFAELEGGIYYSEIEPKCQVLPLLAPHFRARLPQQPWMIHDMGRRQCLVYNGTDCYITPTDTVPVVRHSEAETQYRKLWKEFYQAIEIKERHNERCRMNHMQKRFWKYLPEMQ